MVFTFKLLAGILLPILVLIPFLVVTLPVLTYLVYQKYQGRIRIRNVPHFTIFNIDLKKEKKNLEIESTIHNFLILILIIEISANVSLGMQLIINETIESVNHDAHNSTLETYGNTSILANPFLVLLRNLSGIMLSLILPVLCLFLIVLRRVFINLPYKHWVRRYILYILARLITVVVLFLITKAFHILQIFQLPLTLFDIHVYISTSRAFYVLLKGRRDEAFYHSSRKDYLEKKIITNRFFYTQVLTYVLIAIILLNNISEFFTSLISILYNSGVHSTISSGYFPKFNLPWRAFAYKILDISRYVTDVSTALIDLYIISAYFSVLVSILFKLSFRRKRFNHVNDWITRPLMERYRSTLEGERTQGRPPFIQAFRSRLAY